MSLGGNFMLKKLFILLISTFFLFSCGGGGSSGTPVITPAGADAQESGGPAGSAQGYQVQEKIQAVD